MRVLVAGGGIGGLTLALSLHDAGIPDVHVFEAAPRIRELGVGINVLPHACRELTELGLLDELASAGVPPIELVYYTHRGQRIWGEPRGLAAGYRWPQFSIQRGSLVTLLYRAVCARLGEHRVHPGHRLTAFGAVGGGCRVRAEFGELGTRVEGDVLVACDGIHSVIRRALYPEEGPPRWNGITMWRGVSPQAPFLTGRTMLMAGSFARRIVAYPIAEVAPASGQARINWVAEVRTDPDQPMPIQDWEFRAGAADPLRHFASFDFDFLDVPALIRQAPEIFRYPMVDRDPLPSWDFGRITLLGDAAHPMYPVGSNGASQAILDARVLARELALQATVEAAVSAYDGIRRPETAAVVQANREVGPEQCMEIVEQRMAQGCASPGEAITLPELEAISLKYKRTAGFDPAVLNNRPSLSVPRLLP